MSNSIFISYSRQQGPFVDILLDAMEASGIHVWADYKNLIPGKPWLDQIQTSIRAADIFLLVVSKSSIDSKYVEFEYQHALEQKKRILLVVFEAVPLPSALQACEWIDFRGSFNKKYAELIKQLDQPNLRPSPPQTGFKTSFIVWLTFIVSLAVVVISIPGWWILFLPILLIPLPLQIIRRDFNFYRVRFALITLPIGLMLSWVFFLPYKFTNVPFTYSWVASIFVAPVMLLLLTSKEVRMWGTPIASAPRSVPPHLPEVVRPVAVPFFIENAAEDVKYANAIIAELKKQGHPQVAETEQAQVSFSIISRYKNTISIDPEKQVVFPIIVQDTAMEGEILQRIQAIDFRRGLRNLKSLALLLPEPGKLMRALHVVPISRQVVYPRIIQMLDYFLTLLFFFSISVWIPLWLEFSKQFLEYNGRISFLIINVILSIMILHAVFSSRRALVNRAGKLASLERLIGSILWIGFLGMVQTLYITNVILFLTGATEPVLTRGLVIIFLPFSFILGIILIGIFGIFNWGDLIRWFPQRQTKIKKMPKS